MKKTLALIGCAIYALTGSGAQKPPINVFILSGQSNMVGLGIPGELPLDYATPLTNVVIKAGGDPNKGWGDLKSGYGANGTNFGPELVFGHDIYTNFHGEKVAIIKYSVGGKNLCANYRPPSSGGTTGPLYEGLITFVKAALNELNADYELKVCGLLWMQGESDALDIACATAYHTNLVNFIQDVRQNLGLGTLPVIIGMIDVQPVWKHSAMVRQADLDVAQTITNVSVFDTKGLATDGIHYTTAGQVSLGHLFAKNASGYLAGKGLGTAASAVPLANPSALEIPIVIAVPAELKLVGDWRVEVNLPAQNTSSHQLTARLSIAPPKPVAVINEPVAVLEEWNPASPGWARKSFPGIHDALCSARFALVPGSVKVFSLDATPKPFEPEKDFKIDLEWGALGRVAGGGIGATQGVALSYQFMQRRLDSIILTPQGDLVVRQGTPHIAIPQAPELKPGEERVANLWLPAHLAKLTPDNLFPVLETSFPEPPKTSPTEAERLLPKTLAKLRSGEPLKILAWGDSVTQGYLGEDQWQNQFVRRLQKRFPKANITLVTVGWGAHTSTSFLEAPPGHIRNYDESVLQAHPDLVVSEFVNDASLDVATVEKNYDKFLLDFQHLGAEWIILTPHYNSFMNLTSERNLDNDPRAYVKMVRRFAPEHGVALADAAARYGRLWRQGIPYSTLMVNTANHPDVRGMAIFADSLMSLFP